MVDFNVNGKTALITGGTRGLGYYCAEALVLNGASTVVITSRKAKACEEAKKNLEQTAKENGKTCRIISLPADIAVEQQAEQFYQEVAKQIDKLDILVANAGASWGAGLEDHPVSAVKKVLDLNLVAVFHTIKLFTPLLEKVTSQEDPSRIILMSSVISLTTNDSVGTYGYLASKAGLSHLGKNLAVQFGHRNITVNSLAPGFFPSKMSNGLLEVAGDMMVATNPRHRLGVKEDLQGALLYLCSKQANYINGIVLPVDGGAHLNPVGAKF
ncbi:uncharacterized protein SPAPADRAFT_58163 [Spathaspora passalidarum NRRL Y-27907]|uniref:Rhamnolipids biosynthesis 3-oxoacyl-[acyl-carrier-protein] reductase n=1 Tax=Spathaspora passalidarum (strain NRRL Y-27907 / 11-Y1) TaxID=619300 RepID=G3AFP3_SPAPN|nr:uncharacterized protein SPAPADRAFT_58163 [Spathaspora passalidarum NRRL Y-27907]EGW35032.1 hypothetical protein SPAPADRAFT_58163 [Spathaspora passalidarum NRRL Y-27907]